MSSRTAISTEGASIDEVGGLVTEPVSQAFIVNSVFMAGRIWEAESISSFRLNSINSRHDHWVHPLTRGFILI